MLRVMLSPRGGMYCTQICISLLLTKMVKKMLEQLYCRRECIKQHLNKFKVPNLFSLLAMKGKAVTYVPSGP